MMIKMASYTNRGTKKKPSWQYTISHKPKPIRKGGFRSRDEAKAAAEEIEVGLRKGIVPYLTPEPFDDYFKTWVTVYKPGIGGNTLERYLNTFETIREHFPGTPIQQIGMRDYQEFLNEYGKSHAKSTSRKLNTHIRSCVHKAMEENIILIDFTKGAVVTGKEEKRPWEKHLNFKDSKKLLKTIYKRLEWSLSYYLLLLGLTSGMRYAEMVGLTKKDFDFKNNNISINKTWGYTKKMHEGFGPTKNEQSVRTIKMGKKVMSAFEKLFDSMTDNIYQLVFFSPSAKYHVLSNSGMNRLLKKLLVEIKAEKTISVHGLRHTHASILLYKKATINSIAERLGHKDIQTTNKHYAHVIKELKTEDELLAATTFDQMAS